MRKSIFDFVESKESKNTLLFQNTKALFDKIPNPSEIHQDFKETGLVVGKIQSGKTSNIIGLTAYAFDHGYDVAIMLLSNTNNLLKQNYDRIKTSFSDTDQVKILMKSSMNSNFELLPMDLGSFCQNGNKIIVCSLKHYKHIDEITSYFKVGKNAKLNTLIIDDEGDDTSQNSKVKKSKVHDNEVIEEMSRNNESIINLKNTFNRSCFISVTATPQVQILAQHFQQLKPNFIAKLLPGRGYTGLTTFHEESSKLIRIIAESDNQKSQLFIPDSLEIAIQEFVLLSTLRNFQFRYLNQNEKKKKFIFLKWLLSFLSISKKIDVVSFEKSSKQNFMLIHSVKKLKDQSQIFEKVSDYLNLLCNENSVLLENFFSSINAMKERDFPDFSGLTITKRELIDILKSIQIKLINGNQEVNDISKLEFSDFYILIGADLIDRGITIPNLLVTYMSRETKGAGQIDTLLQRARWFGYREDIIRFCRVYLTEKLKDQYYGILQLEDEMWDWIEYISSNDHSLNDSDFDFNIDSSLLKPTSSDKVFTIRSNFKNAITQLSFTQNKNYNIENIKLIQQIFNKNNYRVLDDWKNQQHLIIETNYGDFKDIISKFRFPEVDPLDPKSDPISYELITRNLDKYLKKEDDFSLIWMRYKGETTRSAKGSSDSLIALLQGRGEFNEENKSTVYPGDRNIHSKNASCQFHIVTLKNDTINYKQGDKIALISVINPYENRKLDEISRMKLDDVVSILRKN